MTILVTGGAGFIGANFVIDWLSINHEPVINLDKLTYAGNLENLSSVLNNDRHIFFKGDICDIELVNKILNTYEPRSIINFAAESHVDRSILSPEAFIQTNIVGTFSLLECAKNYWSNLNKLKMDTFRFLQVSTDEVYGSLNFDDPAFTEKKQYEPNSPYSASKASSDHLVRAYHHTYGLPVLTTNCSNNYGPFQFPEKLIPLVIHNAINHKMLPIYGDGLQIRDWLYVSDHCSAIRAILERGTVGEVYNIGGLNEQTNIQIVKKICKILDKIHPIKKGYKIKSYTDLIKHVNDRPGHDRRYAINSQKIQNELQWAPSETFASGIHKTIEWYLENQSWVENVVNGDYRNWIDKHYK